MSKTQSVTRLIHSCKQGNDFSAVELWRRYVDRIVRMAHKTLGKQPRRVVDEEDIANRAFEAFLQGAKQDRFRKLENREDLWQILAMVTERIAINQIRANSAIKRGNNQVRGDSVFANIDGEAGTGFGCVRDPAPTPESAVILAENVQTLLNQLQDEELQRIAILRMEGFTNLEIAEEIGKSVSTVERKFAIIRSTLEECINER